MLLPITVDSMESGLAHTTLEVTRRRELWPLIHSLPSQPVPTRFETLVSNEVHNHWNIWMQGNTQVDAYGGKVLCVLVKDLLLLGNHPCVIDDFLNRAVWAYLGQLPDTMRVAIYWY